MNSARELLNNTIKTKSGCMEWKGATDPTGYGRVRVFGKSINTHRAILILMGTKIPDGYDVCHKCDNPACINPKHLFVGTRSDNVKDCVKKGRFSRPRGDKHPSYKPLVHGTRNAYNIKKCRCQLCKDEHARLARKYRSRQR